MLKYLNLFLCYGELTDYSTLGKEVTVQHG